MSLAARLGVLLATLAAGVAGWWVMHDDGDGGATATAAGAVTLTSCPGEQSTELGTLATGDEVWLIGVTDGRWGVIRDPQVPSRPAWVPLAMLDTAATARDLPEVTCDAEVPADQVAVTTLPPTTLPGVTTTTIAFVGESTTTTSGPSTTVSGDGIPPTVTLTANREFLYVVNNIGVCANEDDLEVTIAVVDPTLPVSIRSIVATWTGPTGPQTANLTPIGGTRFRLEVPANGPATGETPLTLTATATDGAGNIGAGSLVVALREPVSSGCA